MSNLQGQNRNDNKLDIETRISVLSDSISNLNEKISQLLDSIPVIRQELRQSKLDQEISLAEKTISAQNSLLDGFGALYSWITIIIALLGLALPVLTYLFGIRPANKARKELQKNLDEKIASYLQKNRDLQIDQAIENITSDNAELRLNALNYLSLTQHQGFVDQQFFKIYQVLRYGKIDDTSKAILTMILSSKKSIYADEFFKSADIKVPNMKYYAIKYFVTAGFESYLDQIIEMVKTSNDKSIEYMGIIGNLQSMDKEHILTIMNNKEINNLLSNDDLIKCKNSIAGLRKTWNLPDEIDNSDLMKRISSI